MNNEVTSLDVETYITDSTVSINNYYGNRDISDLQEVEGGSAVVGFLAERMDQKFKEFNTDFTEVPNEVLLNDAITRLDLLRDAIRAGNIALIADCAAEAANFLAMICENSDCFYSDDDDDEEEVDGDDD